MNKDVKVFQIKTDVTGAGEATTEGSCVLFLGSHQDQEQLLGFKPNTNYLCVVVPLPEGEWEVCDGSEPKDVSKPYIFLSTGADFIPTDFTRDNQIHLKPKGYKPKPRTIEVDGVAIELTPEQEKQIREG